jgi:hypothetical protein
VSRRDGLASEAEKIREGERGISLPLAGHERECRENGLGFLESYVELTAEPAMPAESGSREPLRGLVPQEKA